MRLAFLPYGLVSYAAGFPRIDAGLDGSDPVVFVASLALFAVSIVLSMAVQRRARTA